MKEKKLTLHRTHLGSRYTPARARARALVMAGALAMAATPLAATSAAAAGPQAGPSAASALDEPPAAVDWRVGLAVTLAHDKGQCLELASQAYATAAALEGAWVIQNHHLLKSFKPRITNAAGQDIYSDLCGEPRPPLGAAFPAGAFKEWLPVASGDEEALRAAVARGPVRTKIDASHASFQLYNSDVYDEPLCSATQTDHWVTVVGYGTTLAGEDYWTVKNDYGTTWGELGFIRMSRNKDNQCGIATAAEEPVLNPAPYTAPAQNPWPVFP
ncbi:C1 family peptidase [Streptomyces sp. NPDC001568]|uniref:C1 family peptidase n=1 Tax=Streptomyces sp. NPDC001568 TaxID=3364588 RepID=UPI0036CF8D96